MKFSQGANAASPSPNQDPWPEGAGLSKHDPGGRKGCKRGEQMGRSLLPLCPELNQTEKWYVCVCVAHEKWMYSWADLRGLMLWVSVTLSGGDKHQMHQKWWLKPSEGSNYEMRWPGCRFLCSWAEGEGLSRRFFRYPFQSCFLLILANAAWKAPGMFVLPSSELPVSGA